MKLHKYWTKHYFIPQGLQSWGHWQKLWLQHFWDLEGQDKISWPSTQHFYIQTRITKTLCLMQVNMAYIVTHLNCESHYTTDIVRHNVISIHFNSSYFDVCGLTVVTWLLSMIPVWHWEIEQYVDSQRVSLNARSKPGRSQAMSLVWGRS